MGRNTWDAVLASSPLNATAGAVTSKGYQFNSNNVVKEHSWDGPPAMVKLDQSILAQPGFVDLTGMVVGRLKVLGMLARNKAGSNGALWVCRCSCGKYVGRRSKPLKQGVTDRCDDCNYTAHLAWAAAGGVARERAEAPEARKWSTPQPNADEGDGK